MIRNQAADRIMPPDLQSLIHYRQHGVLSLLIWDAIAVVKDNAALLELLDVDGVFVKSTVYLYSLWLDAVQARVFLEVAEEIDLPILILLFILLNILTCES